MHVSLLKTSGEAFFGVDIQMITDKIGHQNLEICSLNFFSRHGWVWVCVCVCVCVCLRQCVEYYIVFYFKSGGFIKITLFPMDALG